MTQLFANNITTTLNGAILAGDTFITVSDGSAMPSPTSGDYFLLTLIGLDGNGNENAWEIVKVTARTGNALTVVRAQEGTSAVGWADATRCELRLTAGSLASWDYTTTAVSKTLANNEHASVTAATQTMTLPATPAKGYRVRISVGAFADTVVARNGSTIRGAADDVTINAMNVTVTFEYDGTTWRVF